ncbi:glycosyltransferase family 4 protein [Acetobacteraceae bacterium ESL0709]|nr:glycosyltransferase family 4 protein [Acetobacteraceae bacterium ESL0697]MDF7678821.1 glycosyltransferase family 4 protein [Acetobacteraceae bacterium ESL0709]
MTTRATPCILQILPRLDAGGVEQGTVDMAEAIVKAGGRALVVSGGGRLVSRLRYVGGEHITLDLEKSFSPFSFFRRVKKVRAICRVHDVDLIHARSRYPAWIACCAARKERIPFVTTWHGVHEARNFLKRFYNSVLVKGQYVIAVSQHVAEKIARNYKRVEDRIRLIPRGCDPDVFNREAVSGTRVQALIERWYIPEGSHIILMAGRLTPWKGQRFLIEALSDMKDAMGGEWVCVFAGVETKTDFSRELALQAQRAGIIDHLRFIGNCTDMPAAYAIADLVVVPSLKPEPFGRVAIEAQMMGCPVIGTGEGGLGETVIDCETGILVSSGNVEALKNAIIGVLTADKANLKDVSRHAHEHAMKYFAKDRMQEETLKVYDAVLGTGMAARFRECLSHKEGL